MGIGIGIVPPTENPGMLEIFGEELSEPVNAVFRGPCFLSVAVEAMECDDAAVVSWGGVGM